jgi:hypothetical protein
MEIIDHPKRLARVTGAMYLIVAIFGALAIIFVRGKVYIPGDAAATAAKVIENSGLVRFGVIADLFQATLFVFVGIGFYLLLKHVHAGAALALLTLVAIATSIMCLDNVFQFESLRVATDGSYATALGAAGSNAIVLLLLDIQHYGYFIAQIFFALWLVPLGYLVYKSGMFPKALGVVLVVGGVFYLVDVLVAFLAPSLSESIHTYLSIPPSVAEVWLLGYLLIIGVRSPRQSGRTPVQV